MKKNHLFLIALGATLAMTGSGKTSSVKADNWSTFTSESTVYNSIYNVPTMSYSIGGETYPATCVVVYPDGTRESSSSIELNQVGQYEFIYSVNVNGEIYSRTENILVKHPQLYIGDASSSSLEYIDVDRAQAEFNSNTPGTYVKLANGDSLNFTRPLKVSNLGTTLALAKGYVVPSTKGATDFTQLIFKVTDYEDDSNFFLIRYYSHIETNSSAYVNARAWNQDVFNGLHQGRAEPLEVNTTYGMWGGHAFDGNNESKGYGTTYDCCLFSAWFDSKTNEVFGTGFNKGLTAEKVLDLDDPSNVATTWGGFTSKYCKLSIYADGYSSSTANFIITNFYDLTTEELKENIYSDETAPEINIDEKYETLPNGVVGCNYPIPEVSAYDQLSGECKVSTKVYLNYGSEKQIDIQIKNGKFNCPELGKYTIEFTAFDAVGNKKVITRDVNIVDSIPTQEITLPTHEETANVGELIELTDGITVTNNVGEVTLKKYIESSSTPKQLVTNTFRITKLEDYTITYEVTDKLGQTNEKSYTLHVTNEGKPILEKELALPKYIISGGYYKIPDISSYYYTNGELEEKKITAKVIDKNGEKTYNAGEEFLAEVNKNDDTVTVEIYHDTTLVVRKLIRGILQYNGRNFVVENYFIGSGFSAENSTNGVVITSTGTNGISFDYANSLLSNSFSIDIARVMNALENSKISVTLTDSEDSNISVKAEIVFDGSKSYLQVNGVKKELSSNAFSKTSLADDNPGCDYKLSISNGQFFVGDKISLPITQKVNGSEFSGFKSSKLYANVSFENVKSGTSMLIKAIGGYVFTSNSSRDKVPPVIEASDSLGGTMKLGSTYTIEHIYASDILAPNTTFTLSVIKPDNSFAKDVNGLTLQKVDPAFDYDVILDSYGQFTFMYEASEDPRFVSRPNTSNFSYYINVYDDIAPTLTFTSQAQITAKVGDIVSFPSFEVNDNVTAKDKLIVQKVILSPEGQYYYFYEDNAMKLDYAGTYTFMINVIDEGGNMFSISYDVNVR